LNSEEEEEAEEDQYLRKCKQGIRNTSQDAQEFLCNLVSKY